MERKMINETIEEKTYRLAHLTNAGTNWFIQTPEIARMSDAFKICNKIVEMALAEEREAKCWISVKDQLPADKQEVVVYDPDDDIKVFLGRYDAENNIFNDVNGGWVTASRVLFLTTLPVLKDEV